MLDQKCFQLQGVLVCESYTEALKKKKKVIRLDKIVTVLIYTS